MDSPPPPCTLLASLHPFPCSNDTRVETSSPNRSIANQPASASDITLPPIATTVNIVHITAAPVFDKHLYNSYPSCSKPRAVMQQVPLFKTHFGCMFNTLIIHGIFTTKGKRKV